MAFIMIVEDYPNQRRLYEEELRREGHETATAKDGREALSLLEHVKPDLVLLDVAMPGLDGIETMIRMLAKDRRLPVVLNTAYGCYQENMRTWAADACVVKSSDLTELKTTIHNVLESRDCGN